MSARDRLDRALLDLAAAGRRPVCGEPWSEALWTSDDADDRAEAARLCQTCPLLEPCAEAADEADERHHVWGGQDWTRHRPKRTTTKETSRG